MTLVRARISQSPTLLLFMCVFTSQAAVLVLSPILVQVAHDLDVSTALAGQLRIFAAPIAAAVAVLVLRSGRRLHLRGLLAVGAACVAIGSVVSATAPSFLVLALAQIPLWIGVAVLVTAGVGAAGSWSAPSERARVVARALAGAPAAWVVGMPAIGLVSNVSWRLAFLSVPLPAALATGALLLRMSADRDSSPAEASLRRLLRLPGARAWMLGELLAMSAWAGTLVFSGALFVERYGTSARLLGLMLAAVAVAYLVGNSLGPRITHECLRRALVRSNAFAAGSLALAWIVTPNALVTLGFLSVAATIVAARTVVGTTYGFQIAGERKLEVGAARAVITHTAYLAGSFLGGAALAVGGDRAVGAVFATLFVFAAIPHLSAWRARCPRPHLLHLSPLRRQPQSA